VSVVPVRTFTAAAALAAAVSVSAAVYVLMQRRCRRLEREATAQRLMAGCETRDNRALHAQVLEFRRRLDREMARPAADPVSAPAGRVPDDEVLARSTRIEPTTEGGPR
jgi:uncharacterized protein HemX